MKDNLRQQKLFALVIELVGIAAIGTGIGIEIIMRADIGLIAITAGSCCVAIGGIVWGKFIRRHKDE